MRHLLLLAALVLLVIPVAGQQEMVFEAEDVSSPKAAWGENITPENLWNLWSKDTNADKKWSGGRVLQSPRVMADRETPEEGAPVLHTVLTGIPKGKWLVTIKFGRGLAVSLDGKEWKRLSEMGGRLGQFEIRDGRFEFWVDDRYADPNNPGFTYYDCITLTPCPPEVNGVMNGDFEFGSDIRSSGWSFWSREGVTTVDLAREGTKGTRCAKIVNTGERDWYLANSGRTKVKPRQTWIATARMKCVDTASATLHVFGVSQGKVTYSALATDGVWGTTDWTEVRAVAEIPADVDEIYLRVNGYGKAQVWVDDVALRPGPPVPAPKPKQKVNGWAKERVWEKLDRGLVAMPTEDGKVYLGWRLLESDPETVAFNVYRASGNAAPVRLNQAPITRTTDFVDENPALGSESVYTVRPVVGGKEGPVGGEARLPANPEVKPYLSIKLQGDYTFQKVGVADLNGDGRLDYVIKTPQDNIDPAHSYWTPSPDTYKLEAYLHDGTFLWRYDMGWAIERGIWYSPYVVWDLDGDGKAEVAVKAGEGDPRGPDGRVHRGPEYCVILDGLTGKPRARVEWPKREAFGGGLTGYNYASRNQMGIAYLDGKTPCLLLARGTYSVMQLVAYQFRRGRLQELWRWDNREETVGNWRGQGAHWMHSGDVDGDGRDEVVLGSCTIDDDGKGLWTTGLGHPDRCFLTDIDPSRPGLEIFYHIEPRQKENGLCIVDAATGAILWGLKEQTWHVGSGMCADIDPRYPGMECWAAEDPKGDPTGQRYHGNPPKWLVTAKGEILARDEKVPSTTAIHWDADALREIVAGRRILKYNGQVVFDGLEGHQAVWADVIGDWREEIITSVPGELRIYTTTIPATDRRVSLVRDPIYRYDLAHLAMGYAQVPCTGYYIAQKGPAVWMSTSTTSIRAGEPVQVKAMLSAPAREAVEGTLKLTVPEGLTASATEARVKAAPGEIAEATFTISLAQAPKLLSGAKVYPLTLTLEGADRLSTVASLRAEEELLRDVPMVQAEDVAAQEGGEIQVRDDKPNVVGRSFSHWDNAGHRLTWKIQVPAEGDYLLVVRYCTPVTVQREVQIDGGAPIKQSFVGTGGFSSTVSDWAHGTVRASDRKPRVFRLKPGEHTITMTNLDGRGMNLDYLALVPAGK